MSGPELDRPTLQIALALALGMIGQVAARHLRVPGIVVLLGLGVALGPDGVGIVRPEALGGALGDLVGFVVAVVLFEGALALDFRELRRQAGPVRRLVTIGALVTAAGGIAVGRLILGWDPRVALLFGTLIVVTGPTVINPLLRRLRVVPSVATVLEGEGILGDAIGATAAVVALETVLAPPGETLAELGSGIGERLLVGVGFGLAAAFVFALVLRFRRLVPDDARNVFVLAILLAFAQASELVKPESGILTAIAAGLLVGNLPLRALRPLREFKEELTSLFLGLLFVLLAADVRLAEVEALGGRAFWAVVALIFVVRPLCVAFSARGTALSVRERLFLSWLAPRGIIAAAVASLFADVLSSHGLEGGEQLQAMVFLLIAVTVTVQGLTGGLVARWLGLRMPAPAGWLILGANALGREMARRLAATGPVLLVDANHDHCTDARAEGLEAVQGNGLDEGFLLHAGATRFRSALGVTANEEVNFLFARRVRDSFRYASTWVALDRSNDSIRIEMLPEIDAHAAFGGERQIDHWIVRFEIGDVELEIREAGEDAECPEPTDPESPFPCLPLIRGEGPDARPFSSTQKLEPGARVLFALERGRAAEARETLAGLGWSPALPRASEPAADEPE